MRRSKIVCTLGPAVDSHEQLVALIEAGMNVARFNFSHGTHAEHQGRYDRVRKAAAGDRPGRRRPRRPPGPEDPPGDLRRGPRRAGAR